jgi:hypothetical protein
MMWSCPEYLETFTAIQQRRLIMRSQSMKKRLKPRRPAKSSQRRSTVSVLREQKGAKTESRWRSLERRHFRALVK